MLPKLYNLQDVNKKLMKKKKLGWAKLWNDLVAIQENYWISP
jgi:hypothetical protein